MRSADTFLPLARLRAELRIPSGVSAADPLLQGHRDEALSFIESRARLPMLDRFRAVFRPRPPTGQQRPDAVRLPFVRSLQAIRYWETGSESDPPDGSLTGAALPRSVPLPDDSGLTVFAPANGWPQMVAAAGMWIVVRVGLPESHRFAGVVRSAGIAFCRHRFNGMREFKAREAAALLLEPVRNRTNGMDAFDDYPTGYEAATPDDGDGVRLTYGGAGITFGGQRLRYD